MKQSEAIGFVISKKNLRDADKIVTAYTKQRGKISFVAKGIKKPRAKLQSHIEPLVETKFRFTDFGKLPILIGAQSLGKNNFFNANPEINLCALFITEVLDKYSVEELANDGLYNSYMRALGLLIESKKTQLILTYSILQMLKALGLEPHVNVSGEGKIFFNYSDGDITNLKSGNESIAIDKDLAKLWNFCLGSKENMILRLSVDSGLLAHSNNLLLSYVQHHTDYKIKSIKVLSEGTSLLQAS